MKGFRTPILMLAILGLAAAGTVLAAPNNANEGGQKEDPAKQGNAAGALSLIFRAFVITHMARFRCACPEI